MNEKQNKTMQLYFSEEGVKKTFIFLPLRMVVSLYQNNKQMT